MWIADSVNHRNLERKLHSLERGSVPAWVSAINSHKETCFGVELEVNTFYLLKWMERCSWSLICQHVQMSIITIESISFRTYSWLDFQLFWQRSVELNRFLPIVIQDYYWRGELHLYSILRPQFRQGYPVDLSISLAGGKETN